MAHTTDAAIADYWASPGPMAEGCISWVMRKRGLQVIAAFIAALTSFIDKSDYACRLLLEATSVAGHALGAA